MASNVTELAHGATTERLDALAAASGLHSSATLSPSPIAGQWVLDVKMKVAGPRTRENIKVRVQFGLSPDGRSYIGTSKARMAVGIAASWIFLALIGILGVVEIIAPPHGQSAGTGVALLAIAVVASLWLVYYLKKKIPQYEADGAAKAFQILNDYLRTTVERS